MKKYRLFAVISAVCICLSILYSVMGVSQTSQSQVLLSTKPPLEKILPFEAQADKEKEQSPVDFTLQAVDAGGKVLTNALIKLQISTPPRNPLLTTDFPIVEGTKLLEMEAVAPDGKLEFQQMLPIRGNYQIQVNVSPLVANSFASYQQTLNLNVRENPVKYKFFAVMSAILLSLGLLGGWVIGGQQEIREGEIAPQSVRLLLSALTVVAIVTLLFINITAEVAEAHGDAHDHKNEKIAPSISQSQGMEVRITGDKLATVGKLANLAVEVKDSVTGAAIKEVRLQVSAIALEDNLTVFAYQGFPNQEGKLIWQEQFFDGAPHKVEVEAISLPESKRQFPVVKVAQSVEVEAIAPPIYIRLIGLFYFTAIVGMGMAIGLLIQHRKELSVRRN
jgi:succinate dehydrogenase hydrophobic anchor subunit